MRKSLRRYDFDLPNPVLPQPVATKELPGLSVEEVGGGRQAGLNVLSILNPSAILTRAMSLYPLGSL